MAVTKDPQIRSFYPDKDSLKKGRSAITYHYTSPLGMKAILGSHSIRFTDCQFLNDKSEYVHIHKPLMQALEEIQEELFDDSIPDMIRNMFNDNYETELLVVVPRSDINPQLKFRYIKQRYYIFCTSEQRDALNMWNYYVKGGNYQGYNLGIAVNSILKSFSALKNENIELLYGKVLYNESEQIRYLKEGILNIDRCLRGELESIDDLQLIDELYDNAKGKILDFLESARLFFKDQAFESEKEFRFIIKLPTEYAQKNHSVLNVGYDVKGGIIVPHCTLNIEKASFKSVTLSPMLDKELAEQGLNRFLTDCGYENKIDINQSGIPIRY
ncbi:DUF2971 domain-containing protein [Anaeromicropila herbilytica]|uniref:DUF2971 domain-containing protein n=1 Tax=Anaeromicropila herbilytica TaxID=2785025 RepID=A0A7R7ICP9_9FIRM|nr:DUF2971 domain-containing protein [Anaeromicropila herbilytica]BCN30978.1 hypothetical protein bsdtb5_22730 [Anaeromicropila herbilytica]